MSLGTFTMLSDEMYAAFLIKAQLVSLYNKKDGGFTVTSSKTRWDAWLETSDLSYKYGEGQNVAEMSNKRVRSDAFKHRKNVQHLLTGVRKDILTIRIGK